MSLALDGWSTTGETNDDSDALSPLEGITIDSGQ
jgi:hypothetical protein